ncbi:titin-like isoform X1 [Arapaima gigas]
MTSFSFVGQVFHTIYTKITSFLAAKESSHKKEVESSVMRSTISGLKDVKTLQMETQKEAVAASHTKTEVKEQIVKKEILYEEVQSYTETKACHTQVTMHEGQSLTLKANIPGASTVRWILNGEELVNSGEYRYGVSGSDHTLTIKKVSQHEEGIITCEAKTEQGIVKCVFETTVTSKRSNAPSFLVQPKSQNVNEGQNVVFTCEVSGDPTPEIEWLKNNVLVCLSPKLKLSRSKNVYTLEIKETSISDSGKYTIKAKNMYGQCSATASLNVLALVEEPAKMIVLEKRATTASVHEGFSTKAVHMATSMQEASFRSSSMAEVKFESMSAASMSSMTSESMVAMSSSSRMEMSSHSHIEGSSMSAIKHGHQGSPPKIEALPEDISIEKGKVLTIACAFSGDPIPEIEWRRSGRTLPSAEDSGRFHVETTEDLTTLIITSVKEKDAGAYTLRLSNELGSDSATVNISIRS